MKRRVSVKELKEYCAQNRPTSILYYSETQPWYRPADPCKMQFVFPTMMVFENPNLICLQAGSNKLYLDRVQSVEIDTESASFGTVITVFCGKMGSTISDATYTLIAS